MHTVTCKDVEIFVIIIEPAVLCNLDLNLHDQDLNDDISETVRASVKMRAITFKKVDRYFQGQNILNANISEG